MPQSSSRAYLGGYHGRVRARVGGCTLRRAFVAVRICPVTSGPEVAQKGAEMNVEAKEQGQVATELPEAMLLTKAQAAALLGIKERSVRRLLARGILTKLEVGLSRCVRIERAEVVDWIAAGCPTWKGWRGRGRRK